MNVIELGRMMEVGDIAYSPEDTYKIIKKENGLFWYEGEGCDNSSIVELTDQVLFYEQWEIELPYVDFWTAWTTAKKEGWAIKYEKADQPICYSNNIVYLSKEMIDGRWQILNR